MPATLTADDRLEIHELIAAYAWALDTADVAGFVRCFSLQGELVWDAFESPLRWQGASELRGFIEGLRDLPDSAGRQHFVSNVRLAGAADGAHATAYVLVTVRQDGVAPRVNVAGYYEDELCVEDGAWRIRRRTIRDWAGPVLAGFAGQTGERVGRAMPAALQTLIRK